VIPFNIIQSRWQTGSGIPVYVGSVPEDTLPPYGCINVVQSNPVVLTSNVTCWNETLLQFSAVTETLAASETLSDQTIQLFDKVDFESVADMTLINRSISYSDQPGLTGNRIWMSSIEFRVRH
jgi:uncharacterized protein YhfF